MKSSDGEQNYFIRITNIKWSRQWHRCSHLEFSGCCVKWSRRVSHDSPRAEMCTFEGPGASNTHQNPRENSQRRQQKERNGGGERKKRAKFWAVQRRGKSKPTTHKQPQPQQRQTQKKWGPKGGGPRRVGPISQGSGFGSLGVGLFGSENLAKTLKH